MSDEREKTATAKVINLLLKREDTLLREWYPTLNDTLMPELVPYGSHYKVCWTCQGRHVWKTTVVNRGGKENRLPCMRRCGEQGENAAYRAIAEPRTRYPGFEAGSADTEAFRVRDRYVQEIEEN